MSSCKIINLVILVFLMVGCLNGDNQKIDDVIKDPSVVSFVEFSEFGNGFFLRISIDEFNEEFFSKLKKAPLSIKATGRVYRAKIHCKNELIFPVWVSVDILEDGSVYFALTDSQSIENPAAEFYWVEASKVSYSNNWLMLAAWTLNLEPIPPRQGVE